VGLLIKSLAVLNSFLDLLLFAKITADAEAFGGDFVLGFSLSENWHFRLVF
jgi:hypothetical protein